MPTMRYEISRISQNEVTASGPLQMLPDNDATVFDARAMLANIGGDDNLFSELNCLFWDRRNAMISNIQAAIVRGDSVALQHAAHTLKGTVGNLCAADVAGLASQLEDAGRLDSLEEAPALIM